MLAGAPSAMHAALVAAGRAPAAAGVRVERRPHGDPLGLGVVPAAARTAAHGSNGVTGVSEPKASATPARCIEANGFIGGARSAPRRWA